MIVSPDAPFRSTIPERFLPLPERLPDFFILGGPKCGTTSLFFWLKEHPDTYLPAKEPNFLSQDIFDARGQPGSIQNWTEYLDRLMPVNTSEQVTGEASPRYLYSDIALSILAQHPSAPKLIVILRNPIDLVHSLHSQMLRNGVESEPDFERAWERALSRQGKPEHWVSNDGRIDRRLDYPLFGKLGARVALIAAKVPRERLCLLILEEDLSHSSKKVLSEVEAFLGLPSAGIETRRHNERSEMRSARAQRYAIGLRTKLVRPLQRIGVDLSPKSQKRHGTGLMKLFQILNEKPRAATGGVSPATRRSLAEYFREDIRCLERTMGRRVSNWPDWKGERTRTWSE